MYSESRIRNIRLSACFIMSSHAIQRYISMPGSQLKKRPAFPNTHSLIHSINNPHPSQDILYFFLGPNIGSPILLPVSLTFAAFCNFSTTSILGKSAPVRSRAATAATSTLALAARSFCVIVAPFWFFSLVRACWRALETSSGTFLVATGPSARSTLVRR